MKLPPNNPDIIIRVDADTKKDLEAFGFFFENGTLIKKETPPHVINPPLKQAYLDEFYGKNQKPACKLIHHYSFFTTPSWKIKRYVQTLGNNFEISETTTEYVDIPYKKRLSFIYYSVVDDLDNDHIKYLESKNLGNIKNKYAEYACDTSPDDIITYISSKDIFVKSCKIYGQPSWIYSDTKHDQFFIPFDEVKDKIDPTKLYWIDTYHPEYRYKPSDTSSEEDNIVLDAIQNAPESPDTSIELKVSNILKQYEERRTSKLNGYGYNNYYSIGKVDHYTTDPELIKLLVNTIKTEINKNDQKISS
jgi:hypothetical protein